MASVGNFWPFSQVAAKEVVQPGSPAKLKSLLASLNVQSGPPLRIEIFADAQNEQVDVAVAGDVERVGADDVVEQMRIGADVERLLLEFERAAARRFVDEQLCRVLAAGEEHAREARAVAIEGRAAAADEMLPGAVVGLIEARGGGLFVHDGDVGEGRGIGEGGGGEEERRPTCDRRESGESGADRTSALPSPPPLAGEG